MPGHDYEALAVSVSGQVCHVRMDTDAPFNALTPTVVEELLDVAVHCNEEWDVRATALTGSDDGFCAGADLRLFEGGDYGTFTTRVEGTRWELKWDRDGASYLRVGGSGGCYVLSQYEHPSAADIREYAPQFHGFVDAYNDHVEELESDLETVAL